MVAGRQALAILPNGFEHVLQGSPRKGFRCDCLVTGIGVAAVRRNADDMQKRIFAKEMCANTRHLTVRPSLDEYIRFPFSHPDEDVDRIDRLADDTNIGSTSQRLLQGVPNQQGFHC